MLTTQRWLAAAFGLGSLAGCANVAAPPGGPPDSIPPALIAIQPDSYSVVAAFKDEVRFQFDEPISERNLQVAVIVYPFEPRPKVGKGKQELRVRPRGGWVAERIYHLRVEPVVQDLFNNRIAAPIYYVFSTGPPIPANLVEGTIFDRITERTLPQGRVDMVRLPDTLRYGGSADSLGAFRLRSLPEGEYYAIGFEDLNNNKRADAFDRADTARVSLGSSDTLRLEFRVFRRDTLGPQLMRVEPIDSLSVALEFDGYLDPEAPLSAANVDLITLPDSARLAIAAVLHAWRYRQRQDSLAQLGRAPDEEGAAGVRPDTTPRAPPRSPPARGAGQEVEEQEELLPLPDRRIYVIALEPIPPGEIVVRVSGIINLSGLEGGGQLSFEQPAPAEAPPPEPPPEAPPNPPVDPRRGPR